MNKVKSHFPNAIRIDIGFAQRMKYTRYAFIRYDSVAESIAAYKSAYKMDLGSRSLVIRFRRKRGNIGLYNGPTTPVPKPKRKLAAADINHDEADDCCDILQEDLTGNEENEFLQDSKHNVLNDGQQIDVVDYNRQDSIVEAATVPSPPPLVPPVPYVQVKIDPDAAAPAATAPANVLGRDIKKELPENCDDISDDEYFNGGLFLVYLRFTFV